MAVLAGEYFRGESDEKLCAVTGIKWTEAVASMAAEGQRVALVKAVPKTVQQAA